MRTSKIMRILAGVFFAIGAVAFGMYVRKNLDKK